MKGIMSSTYDTWKTHPTGKIPMGAFCEHCARYNTRCSTVEVIVTNDNNEILLIRRAKLPEQGSWALPGGYVDWNEKLSETARREVKEETGFDVRDITFLGLFDDPARDKDGRQNIGHCFVALVGGDAKKEKSEVEEMSWFSLSQLPKEIAFDHQKMIEQYAKTVYKENP